MQAITHKSYGDPIAALKLEDVAVPKLTDDAVRIRVRAAAINKGDWHLTTGVPYIIHLLFGLRRPSRPIAGQEVAGVVEAVGAKVTTFKPGDAVFGQLNGGAFAEYAVTSEQQIVPMPANATFAEAATMGTGIAALQGLRDFAKVTAGQDVLINGAGGGVGTFAVQIAKSFGANVTAVCSGAKAEMVRALGADRIIDYTREDFAAEGARYDVMFDLVGNRPVRECRRAVKRGGMYVASAGGKGKWLNPLPRMLWLSLISPFSSHRLALLFPPANMHDYLADMKGLLERGDVKPAIGRQCSLAEVPEAMQAQGQGHTAGKTVVAIHAADETP